MFLRGEDRIRIFDFLGFTHYCDKTRKVKFKPGRKTASSKHRKKIKAMNLWMKKARNQVKLKEWREVLLKSRVWEIHKHGSVMDIK